MTIIVVEGVEATPLGKVEDIPVKNEEATCASCGEPGRVKKVRKRSLEDVNRRHLDYEKGKTIRTIFGHFRLCNENELGLRPWE